MDPKHESTSQEELLDTLRALQAEPRAQKTVAQLERVLHDLEVHQIELQMQNRELREAQQLLEESRSRYADLFDYAPVGYCTFDQECALKEANLTVATLFGVERAALSGDRFLALLKPVERDRLCGHVRQVFSEGRSLTTDLAVRMTERGELIVQMVSTPVFGIGGKVVATRTTLTDVSALKQSERVQRFINKASEALASSLDYEQTLVTVVRLAVPVLADICFVDLVDDTGMLRRLEIAFADPAKAALGPQIKRVVHSLDDDTMQAQVVRGLSPLLVSDRSAASLTTADIGAAGPARSAMFIPLLARDVPFGALTLIMAESRRTYTSRDLVLALDVARRAAVAIDNARLYHTAQRATQTRDDVLAVVAHDLKNPLASVTLGASTLLGTPPESDRRKGRKQLESIRRAAERMSRLIGDLVDVTSLEAGQLSFSARALDAGELLEDALALLQPLAQAKGVQIQRAPSEPGLTVTCDRERTLQVLSNLMGNAVKFTSPQGEVQVRATREGEMVCFSVRDSGPGIAPELREHVFERYVKAHDRTREGSGLGLYIAKLIVEAQRGKIGVCSELGAGSTFFFELPVRPAARVLFAPHALASSAADLAAVGTNDPPSARVLVVDDDAEIREAVGDLLQHKGYCVTLAANGREAVEYLRAAPAAPALMLLDLEMPEMDGPALVAQLRHEGALQEIPFVLVSSQHDLAEQAERLGAAAYLRKPIQLGRLLATVESHRTGAGIA